MENNSAEAKGVVFGRALEQALAVRGLTQADVGTALGTTQSTISAWKRGQCEPDMEMVFAVERLLELRPGHLSRHLGYLPLTVEIALPTVEDAISRSTEVDDDGKKLTLVVWTTMKKKFAGNLQVATATGTRPRAKTTDAGKATGKTSKATQASAVAAAKAADTDNAAVIAKKAATRKSLRPAPGFQAAAEPLPRRSR